MSLAVLDFRLKSAILWNTAFLSATAIALYLRTPANIGIYLLGLVVLWDVLFFFWARTERSTALNQILRFSMILSLFQVFPDWVLSRILGVLVFPADGLLKWDTVSGYMAGLWAIPASTLLVVYVWMNSRTSKRNAYAAALVVGALLFIGSEELVWLLPSWYATGVKMWGHVAVYIIVPELLLTLMITYAFEWARTKSLAMTACAAASVSVLYTFAAVVFHRLIG